MSKPDDGWTVGNTREWLHKNRRDGVECPTCDQDVKEYERHLTLGQVKSLYIMHAVHGTSWHHVPSTTDLARKGGDIAKMRWWGLIEEMARVREDGGHAGWWRVTEHGVNFLNGVVPVREFVYTYNGEVVRKGGGVVWIGGVTKHFDLKELMNS